MAKIRAKKRIIGTLGLVLGVSCLLFSYSNAFAWGHEHERGRYRYHDGRWHERNWWGFEVVVPSLRVGAVVSGLPRGYSTVIIGGIPYYYYDSIYYRSYNPGYIVVPEPAAPPVVVVPAPAATQQSYGTGDTVTISVPNSSGGYTPITLTKHNNGYIGPQGEYYEGNPTVDQLKVLYGK